jgi:hypothetical protein
VCTGHLSRSVACARMSMRWCDNSSTVCVFACVCVCNRAFKSLYDFELLDAPDDSGDLTHRAPRLLPPSIASCALLVATLTSVCVFVEAAQRCRLHGLQPARPHDLYFWALQRIPVSCRPPVPGLHALHAPRTHILSCCTITARGLLPMARHCIDASYRPPIPCLTAAHTHML